MKKFTSKGMKSAQKLKRIGSKDRPTPTQMKIGQGRGGRDGKTSILTSSTRLLGTSLAGKTQELNEEEKKSGRLDEKSIISKQDSFTSTQDSYQKKSQVGNISQKIVDAKSCGLIGPLKKAKKSAKMINKSLKKVKEEHELLLNTKGSPNSNLVPLKSVMTRLDVCPGMIMPSSISSDAQGGFGLPAKLRNMGYHLGKVLGEGGFAKVFVATNERLFPGKPLACKIVNLRQISLEWRRKHLDPEMNIMNDLHHPNTMHAYFMAKSSNAAFIFMPLAEEGTVRTYIDMQQRPLATDLARRWFRGLIDGLTYLHDKDIVHRDLKLENFFLRHRNQETIAVIGDFGFAVKQENKTVMATLFGSDIQCQTACGTADYVAPEVHCLSPNEKYCARPVDIYAMGVSLFEMLNYWRPFFDMKRLEPYQMHDQTLVNKQKTMQFFWNPRSTANEMAKKIIVRMLQPKPSDRPLARDVLTSPWVITTN